MQCRQYQQRRKNGRGDKGNFAFAFEKADQAADQQQHDVNPKDFCGKIIHEQRVP